MGIKKGEKVDYAILNGSIPSVLIECKWCEELLDKHGSQLFRYFSTTQAKFGIHTNGIDYKFYTDLEESNKIDMVPFLEINMLNLREHQLSELKKFCKANFDSERIFSTAEELKNTNLVKDATTQEELDAYYIIRGFLVGVVPIEDITHRDTESYLGILYKDNNRKPICRINLDKKNKQIQIPDENKKFDRYNIESLNDIYLHKNKLIESVNRYL